MKTNTKFTPANITELQPDEIFVFGSNKAGNHAGGAARVAVDKFGAIMGQAEGPQGRSYAIPTLDEQMQKVSIDDLTRSVRRFADYSIANSDKTFFVTKIGCGIAGFSVDEIAEVFRGIAFGPNVVLPKEFGEDKHIVGYKGFDNDMTCRGFQFREGETFEEDVVPEVCCRGFHFCESPLSVLHFRPLLDDQCQFTPVHMVIGKGKTVSDGNKMATTKIQVGPRLDLPGFIKAGVYYLCDKCIAEGQAVDVISGDEAQIGSSGDWAKIGSSGYRARIGSSGDWAKIGSSGDEAQIGSSGDWAKIGSSGDEAQIGSLGDEAQIGSSGDWAKIGSSGYGARIGSSGNWAKIGSSGDEAQIGSSGDEAQIGSSGYRARIGSSGNGARIGSSGYRARIGSSGNGARIGSSGDEAQIGSSGDWAKIGSSGNGARIGSSGYRARIGSSGYGARIGSSGNRAKIESAGKDAVIAAIGVNSIVKAKKGSWITLAEYDDNGKPVCVKSAQVDEKALKSDVFYQLRGGEFVEVSFKVQK